MRIERACREYINKSRTAFIPFTHTVNCINVILFALNYIYSFRICITLLINLPLTRRTPCSAGTLQNIGRTVLD